MPSPIGLLKWIGRNVDELVDMGYPIEVAKRISSGELDPSRPAAMQRFAEQGYIPTSHGTVKNWGEVDPNRVDIGLHSGTQDQANIRLRDISAGRLGSLDFNDEYTAGANIMPLMVKAKNPLEMNDVGQWENAQAVAESLLFHPKFSANRAELEDIYQHMDDVLENSNLYDSYLDIPDNRSYLDRIREMITDKGYDSIRYDNKVENKYGNFGGYTPEAQARADALNNRIKELENQLRDQAPEIPKPNDPDLQEKLNAFLNYQIPKSDEIEALRKELISMKDNPANSMPVESYISLDPSGVKSAISGMADPEYTGSNILGSRMTPTAAAGLLGILGLTEEDLK